MDKEYFTSLLPSKEVRLKNIAKEYLTRCFIKENEEIFNPSQKTSDFVEISRRFNNVRVYLSSPEGIARLEEIKEKMRPYVQDITRENTLDITLAEVFPQDIKANNTLEKGHQL